MKIDGAFDEHQGSTQTNRVDERSRVREAIRVSGAVAGASAERMTWEQICAAYRGQWVLMVDVDWVNDTDLDLRSAVVLAHGDHRQLGRVEELVPEHVEFTHLFIFRPGYEM